MRVLDLFSGLGGWSEAFKTAGHEVLRIENNPLLKDIPRTHLIDIKEFRDSLLEARNNGETCPFPEIDLITASPPCLNFSNAFNAPKSNWLRENPSLGVDDYEPDLELLNITLEIIDILKPKYYIIENVVGSIRYFKPKLGVPRQIIGAFVLWGNYPEIIIKNQLPSKASKDKRWSKLRSNHKAKIPIQLSHGLLIAILEQTNFNDYWL